VGRFPTCRPHVLAVLPILLISTASLARSCDAILDSAGKLRDS